MSILQRMSLTAHRVIQYMVIITLCTLAGGGYWYWKDQQAKAAVTLKTATDTGLIGYWSFDEGSGTKAEDFSPDGTNTGTLTNSPTWVAGKAGKALSFNATNSYIDLGSSNTYIGTSAPFSVSFWMKANTFDSNQRNPFALKTDSTTSWIGFQLAGGSYTDFTFGKDSASSFRFSYPSSPVNKWVHILITYNGSGFNTVGNYAAYFNGTSVSLSTSSTLSVSSNANYIGKGSGAGYWDGSLDEFRVYNRVLTAAEIANLYQTTAEVKANAPENSELMNGLVGLWSFNGADVSGTTAYDRSGQGNDGTLTNGPTVTAGKIGQALRFDGSDDYVSLGSNRAGATKNAITVSYVTWVKPTAFQDYGNFYRESVNSSTFWRFACGFRSTGKPVCGGRAPDGQSLAEWRSDTAVSLNEWHHFAATVDVSTDTVQIYIDGILQTNEANGTFTNAVFDNTNSHSISIGATSAGTERFTGDIDEVRVYNRVLSATEIWNLYQAGGGAKVNSADSQSDALERGLAGYWKLDDGSGTSATDASTNGSTGTLTNGPTWTTGKIGGAVSFDGTDDYIIEAGTTQYKFTSSFAFGGWFKSTGNQDSVPVAGFDSGSSDRYNLVIDNAGAESFQCNVRLTGGQIGAMLTTTVVTGDWYHLYCSYDDSLKVMTLYINGTKVAASSTGSGSLTDGGSGLQKFAIGRSNGSSYTYWTGIIDEVRLYNRSLSAEEIAKLYQSTAPDNPDTGLKGYWSFNGADVSGTTAFDRSGVGNNGTLNNGPVVTPGKIGQALSFDGNNDYVSAGDVNAVDGASTLTLSGWFKRSASNAHLTVGKTTNAGRTFSINFYNDGRAYVNVGTGGGVNSYGYFTSNDTDWHHVVFVFDGNLSGNANRAKAYLDGVQQSLTFSNTIPAATQASSDSFEIGRDQTLATYSSGGIDEVRLYSRAFTQTEVTNLYNLGR
jgi:hypothetical protein